jgi:hypothetical protein
MTFFEYIKNEATIEQIAQIFDNLENDGGYYDETNVEAISAVVIDPEDYEPYTDFTDGYKLALKKLKEEVFIKTKGIPKVEIIEGSYDEIRYCNKMYFKIVKLLNGCHSDRSKELLSEALYARYNNPKKLLEILELASMEECYPDKEDEEDE